MTRTRHRVVTRSAVPAALAALAFGAGCPRAPCPAVPATPPATAPAGLVQVAGGLVGDGEGMWPVGRLDVVESMLAAAGRELPLGLLWSDGGGPAQAAVDLEGCTASFVSAEGLLLSLIHI